MVKKAAELLGVLLVLFGLICTFSDSEVQTMKGFLLQVAVGVVITVSGVLITWKVNKENWRPPGRW